MNELVEVFRRVFDDDAIHLDERTHDVVGWNSLSHVNLILAIEQRFAIHFRRGSL